MLVRTLGAIAHAAGRAVRATRKYGLAYGSAALIAVGAAILAQRVAVGFVVAGVFGLVDDHRRSV